MNSYKSRLQPGLDDPLLAELRSVRSESAWLAAAIETFFDEFGADDLGECDGEPKQITAYNVQVPKWASSYLDRVGGYRSRLIRAAAWFYLGRLSATFDVKNIMAEIKRMAGKSMEPSKVLTDEEHELVNTLVDQF